MNNASINVECILFEILISVPLDMYLEGLLNHVLINSIFFLMNLYTVFHSYFIMLHSTSGIQQ